MSVKIAPSILSADFGRLAEEVKAAEEAGADWIHVDVMDGHFVPNITMGPEIVGAVRRATSLPLDVHLMIESPERHLAAFADRGANLITVHQETCPHLHRTVEQIRELGVSPGVTLNPATPISTLVDILSYVDLLLVMSVNPGWGGQGYIPSSTPKIQQASRMIEQLGRKGVTELEVDGGIKASTAATPVRAGATVLVAGNYVYKHPEGVAAAVRELRRAAEAGTPGTKLV
jgi:ribulose-phosphate 3-epimerase